MGERRRGSAEPDRGGPAHLVPRNQEEGLSPQGQHRHTAGPSPWLASDRETRPGRRAADIGESLRLRTLHVPQRAGNPGPRQRAIFLPPEARKPPRGAALERRLQPRPGRVGRAARQCPRDGAHRDHPRGLRDARDPLRAQGPCGRAERGALGLHLQLDQEVPDPEEPGVARPRAGVDDRAVHAGVYPPPGAKLPPPGRARHRRHGLRSSRAGRTRRSTRSPWPK